MDILENEKLVTIQPIGKPVLFQPVVGADDEVILDKTLRVSPLYRATAKVAASARARWLIPAIITVAVAAIVIFVVGRRTR